MWRFPFSSSTNFLVAPHPREEYNCPVLGLRPVYWWVVPASGIPHQPGQLCSVGMDRCRNIAENHHPRGLSAEQTGWPELATRDTANITVILQPGSVCSPADQSYLNHLKPHFRNHNLINHGWRFQDSGCGDSFSINTLCGRWGISLCFIFFICENGELISITSWDSERNNKVDLWKVLQPSSAMLRWSVFK